MTGHAPRHIDAARVIAGPKAEKPVSLALQGGGAHGAFTWGVLDAILEDGRLAIEAISGASAGAMNAVVLAEGYLAGGIEGARAQLETFWRRASINGGLSDLQRGMVGRLFGFWSGESAALFSDLMSRVTSPYETNPLNINSLRSLLEDLVDFKKVRACSAVKLFISATNVHTGKVTIFQNKELSADHLMASACLPTVFQAVEIDGVPYWDGGYTGNPALFPLFYEAATDDILLVQINPIERNTTPRSAREISDRLNEISFNATLMSELRAVDFVARLVAAGKLSREDYKAVRMHRIDADKALADVSASSRLDADWDFFQTLSEAGRAAARDWLKTHFHDIGIRATIDLERTIGPHRHGLSTGHAHPPGVVSG